MARGVEQKLIDADTRRDFAANTLVLIIPAQDAPPVSKVAARIPSKSMTP